MSDCLQCCQFKWFCSSMPVTVSPSLPVLSAFLLFSRPPRKWFSHSRMLKSTSLWSVFPARKKEAAFWISLFVCLFLFGNLLKKLQADFGGILCSGGTQPNDQIIHLFTHLRFNKNRQTAVIQWHELTTDDMIKKIVIVDKDYHCTAFS